MNSGVVTVGLMVPKPVGIELTRPGVLFLVIGLLFGLGQVV